MNSLKLVQHVEPSMEFTREEIRSGAETIEATVDYRDTSGEKKRLPIVLGRCAVFADGDLAFMTKIVPAGNKFEKNGLLTVINGLTYLSI